jgi:hypothetical protein
MLLLHLVRLEKSSQLENPNLVLLRKKERRCSVCFPSFVDFGGREKNGLPFIFVRRLK